VSDVSANALKPACALYDAAWREGLRPEPQSTVSAWADGFRRLPSTAAEPGFWRTSRTPYLREIMDSLSTGSNVERVVFMKGAQLGGTEAGLNWLGYIIHHAPGLALLVMPSIDMVRRNTRTRIDPLIEGTPELAARVVVARSRDPGNTATQKKFIGGELVMTGANSAAALRSTPARYLFLDEVDAFPLDVEGEGDPVALAIKRSTTFRGKRKILMVSTPTLRDFSRIEAAYLESDRRRYLVPCPHCGVMQPIEWARIRWPEGEPMSAWLECAECASAIDEAAKPAMLATGEWRATVEGDGRTAGFHLSSLYSPFETWGEIAAEFLRVKRDPSRLKTWVNTALAETWSEGQGHLEPEGLAARAEDWGAGLPEAVAVVTAGVDVQDDRLEIEIVGHGRGDETWSLAYHVLYGDPAGEALWGELDALLLQRWPHPRAIPDLPVRAVCIDSGGHFTGRVVEFAATRTARRVWAIKGAAGVGRAPWPRKPSRSAKTRLPLYVIGVDALKEAFHARLAIAEPGPGYCHFPDGRDATFFQQLTAEKIVTRYRKGRPVREWRKRDQDRNEALDCRVYALAALEGLKSLGLRLDVEAGRLLDAPMRASVDPVNAPAAPNVIRSKWMEG
jgi:phage terminase large subunit GpA-like protein